MLAKMWKKVLLAICIIACIYNVMSKLVNRGSLEANLRRANDGNTVFDFSSKDPKINNTETDEKDIENTTSKNEVNNDTVIDNENIEDNKTNTVSNEDESKEESSQTFKFTDFIFKW